MNSAIWCIDPSLKRQAGGNSLQRQNPCGGEAAGTNGNADGGSTKPVEQGDNQIDAPDQGQRWHNDADRERIESKPSPEGQTCNQQHAKAVAKVKANPSSPHVRASSR